MATGPRRGNTARALVTHGAHGSLAGAHSGQSCGASSSFSSGALQCSHRRSTRCSQGAALSDTQVAPMTRPHSNNASCWRARWAGAEWPASGSGTS